MAKVFVDGLVEGEAVTTYLLVRAKHVRRKKTGESFLSMVLGDRTGEVPAVMWDGCDEVIPLFGEGDVVKVHGILGTYQRERQLTVQRLRKAQPSEIVWEEFLPRTQQDVGALLQTIRDVAGALQNPHLRRLLEELLADPAFVAAFSAAPAAKELHHAALGGLLEHTVSVVRLCQVMAGHYPRVDRDLLLASAILHDVGKLQELQWDGAFEYTDQGRLLGHVTLGAMFVRERIRALGDFPTPLEQELIHNILSHHGEYEWGSPKRPKTLEAIILHHVENLDGKVDAFLGYADAHRDPHRPTWTTYNRSLERYLYVGEEAPGDEREEPDAGDSGADAPATPSGGDPPR